MEKNTQNYNELTKKLESIFDGLAYTYKKIDFNDDDLNYIVSINTSGLLTKLKKIDVLLYAGARFDFAHLLIKNVYNFSEGESIEPFYKKINKANEFVTSGSFIINDSTRQVLYLSSIYCGSNFSELSANKISLLINSAMSNLEILFNIINDQDKE